MNAKTTIVKLSCEAIGVKQREFEISHAERLMSIPNNGGWIIDDEDYELGENGNILRRHKREADKARKTSGQK